MRFLAYALIGCQLTSMSMAAAAPPQVTSLYPAGGQRGQTVTVTAAGSFANWPVQVWSDQQGITCECGKEKGQFTVTIAPDAPLGSAWLRMFDQEGSSAPRPFVVGSLPEISESEPNDEPRKPQSVGSSVVVINGQLSKSGDVDSFALPLAKGQTLVAAIEANQLLGSPMDAVLQIVSPQGFVLTQNDDERGIDPLLVFTAPADGEYLVRTFAFPATPDSSIRFAGGTDFVYRLTATTAGFIDATWPLSLQTSAANRLQLLGWNLPADGSWQEFSIPPESTTLRIGHAQFAGHVMLPVEKHSAVVEVNSGMTSPQVVELPVTVTGRLDKAGETDTYEFQSTKGARVAVRVESRALGYPLDPYLAILDAGGAVLSSLDDTRGSRDAELLFVVPSDGRYRVAVRDLHRNGGPRYFYRLRLALAVPDFTLALSAEAFVMKAGANLEIPVTIDRANGFAEDIELELQGLPEGITALPAKSEGKGASAKQVKLQLSNAKGAYSGAMRVIGRSLGDAKLERTARAPLTIAGQTIEQIWLTAQ